MSNPDSIPDVPPAIANVAVAPAATVAAAAAARFNSRRGRFNYDSYVNITTRVSVNLF